MGRGSTTVIRETLGTARAQLDDLQAELEAGTRQADKIANSAAALDLDVVNVVKDQQSEAQAELSVLRTRAAELRASLREQRELMRQLRDSFDSIRRHVGRLG
jgi:chromosome segregation ATPase